MLYCGTGLPMTVHVIVRVWFSNTVLGVIEKCVTSAGTVEKKKQTKYNNNNNNKKKTYFICRVTFPGYCTGTQLI